MCETLVFWDEDGETAFTERPMKRNFCLSAFWFSRQPLILFKLGIGVLLTSKGRVISTEVLFKKQFFERASNIAFLNMTWRKTQSYTKGQCSTWTNSQHAHASIQLNQSEWSSQIQQYQTYALSSVKLFWMTLSTKLHAGLMQAKESVPN